MKYRIDKETFDTLNDDTKGEYEDKDGAYVLKLEGYEEDLVPSFKKAEAEKHRQAAEKRAEEAEERANKLVKEIQESEGNKTKVAELTASFQKQVEELKAKHLEEQERATQALSKSLIEQAAGDFAAKHFTVPSLVKDAFAKRLSVETVDGQQVIRTWEADGKASAKSLQELQQEFLDSDELKPIIKANNSSGGGVTGESGDGVTKTMPRAAFENLGPKAQDSFIRDGGTIS